MCIGLNGAMSNIRMNGPDRNFANGGVDNFDLMLLEEITRRCGSSRRRVHGSEGSLDSPTRKRSRHF